ncbi:MAG: TetR/AcrR family transcriptional regulator [Clostridia bacterium]|nr:TetR/AcrR family transcriptional regulator [Clostridia bacterium]
MTKKQAKRDFVTDAAIELFLERPLAAVTIRDVAEHSDVGEATVYRYFTGRTGLIVACALKLQKAAEQLFLGADGTEEGFPWLQRFFETYLHLFRRRPQLYRFLHEFDAYCIQVPVDRLDEYADGIDRFKTAFAAAYRAGVQNRTVRVLPDMDLFYYAATHAVLALCKKLASEEILRQDKGADKAGEIQALIDMILFSLRGDEAL